MFDITAQKQAEERPDRDRAAASARRSRTSRPSFTARRSTLSSDRFYISPSSSALRPPARGLRPRPREFWLEPHPSRRRAARSSPRTSTRQRHPGTVLRATTGSCARTGTYTWVHDEATWVEEVGLEGWWQGFMLDISERHEAERQLRRPRRSSERSSRRTPAVIYTQEFDPDSAHALPHDLHLAPAGRAVRLHDRRKAIERPHAVDPDDPPR